MMHQHCCHDITVHEVTFAQRITREFRITNLSPRRAVQKLTLLSLIALLIVSTDRCLDVRHTVGTRDHASCYQIPTSTTPWSLTRTRTVWCDRCHRIIHCIQQRSEESDDSSER